jgi:hypothetical protein
VAAAGGNPDLVELRKCFHPKRREVSWFLYAYNKAIFTH